jgi:AcrR family transcriptional regulator
MTIIEAKITKLLLGCQLQFIGMLLLMAVQAEVTPNRRGKRSRELVLGAAERVMAREGFDATTVARVVAESGIPESSVYHYFGSKDGVLLAVMERGAERFFEHVPEPDELIDNPITHLSRLVDTVCAALEQEPNFLRLVVVMAAQPPLDDREQAREVVERVRELALARLRRQFAIVFGVKPNSRVARDLARFALAAFDGAFIAWQADPAVQLKQVLRYLPAALVGAHDTNL